MLIGELSRLTGISTRMLRHYDSIGLVSPKARSANGYRDYSPDDISRLFRVESLRTLGLPLPTIRRTLADTDVTATALVDQLIASTNARIAREQSLLRRLTSVRDSEVTSWRDVLDLVALMQELDSADPSRRQRVALSDIAAVPAGSIVDSLIEETDPNVAGALQWSLTRSGRDALPHLVAALSAADEQARHRAIAAIVKMNPEAAEPVLRQALRHPDRRVREQASLALGSRGDLDAAPELLDMIVRGSDDVQAAETLGRLAHQHAIGDRIAGMVARRLTDDQSAPGERSRLTQALADIPGPRAHAALTELLDDPDPAVSLTARYVLAIHPAAADG
jgi:DNA-binding transcriptional MerR regulator